eukprot:Gb_37347 [translate_table: standard]
MMLAALYVLFLLIQGGFQLHSPLHLIVADDTERLSEWERINDDVQYLKNVRKREELCMLRMHSKVETSDCRYCMELQVEPNISTMGPLKHFSEYFKWLKLDVVNSIIPEDGVGPLGAQIVFGLSDEHCPKGTNNESAVRKLANITMVKMLLKELFGSIAVDRSYNSKRACESSKYTTVLMDSVLAYPKGNDALHKLLSRPLFDSFMGLVEFDNLIEFWHEDLFLCLSESQFCQSFPFDSLDTEDTDHFCESSFLTLMLTKLSAAWHQHPATQRQVKQFSFLLNHEEGKGLFISYCEIGSWELHGYAPGSLQSVELCEPPQEYDKENHAGLKMIDLHRKLNGKGAHRQLSSIMKFNFQWNHSHESDAPFCEIVMMQRLQPGIFADPFELQHLVHRGALNAAYVYGDVNLELPSHHSHQSIVEVHAAINVDSTLWSQKNIEVELKIDLPLHARYPPLSMESYSMVAISIPHVLLHCEYGNQMVSVEASGYVQKQGNKTWSWITWGNSTSHLSAVLEWRIPAGNQLHAKFVSIFTAFSALVSIMAIFIASLYSLQSY